MAINPIGEDTHKGQTPSLFGDVTVEKQNSSNYIRTYVQSSGTPTGGFLVGMSYRENKASSLLEDLAKWDIDADGGFRSLSGTTILLELNSSGLYVGSTRLIDSSGGFFGTFKGQQGTVSITSNSTILLSTNSGKLHLVSTGTYSSVLVQLPTSASAGLAVGMYWDILSNDTAAGVVYVALGGGDNAGGTVHAHIGSTGAVASTIGVKSASSGIFFIRALCVAAGAAPSYAIQNLMSHNSVAAGAEYYDLAEGTSVLS